MFENGAKNEVQKQEPYLDIILRMDNVSNRYFVIETLEDADCLVLLPKTL